MISYGNLTSRRPVYLRPDTAHASNVLPFIKIGRGQKSRSGDDLSRIIMTTVSDPRRWHDVCEALVSLSLADYAVLYPADDRIGTFYFAGRNVTAKCFAGHQLLKRVLSQPTTGFVADDNLHWYSSQCLRTDVQSATTLLLNFGLDGVWLLRVGCHESSAYRNEWNPELLKAWESELKTAAKMSGKSFKAALRTRKTVHGQLHVAFACLDSTGRLLTQNAAFERNYPQYFHLSDGILLPTDPGEARAFQQALNALSGKAPVQDLPLGNGTGPCIGTLRRLPESLIRVSRAGAIGLTLHGVVKATMQPPLSLSWLFGLSKREAEVTSQLAIGKTVTIIATLHDVSVATVRAQVKSIFRKLKVNSQLELVVKILGSGI